ncbi:hypothetical protein F5884DRAFT_449123 [Xylogone sp. PMI_703]|nr:hypothetical protein F5884DRAFT_449123 [Xylogone sp. PMI_703]
MPKILITGAAGFIGQLLAKRLLNDESYTVTLTDINKPPIPKKVTYPSHATSIKADLCDDASLQTLIPASNPPDAIYVFHGIMSSGSEANLDLGLTVNLDATYALLNHLRKIRTQDPSRSLVRVIYASSLAVYGGRLPSVLSESTRATPEGSYGSQKLIIETLINDFTRRGLILGFNLRFPTISVRAGKPTQAASSFLSGMIREPLAGIECVIPLKDRSFKSWLCSPKTLCENLIRALSLAPDSLPIYDRVVNVPGRGFTIQEMMDALAEVGGKDKLALLKEETDVEMERILRSWGDEFDNTLGLKLGLARDGDFVEFVKDYAELVESEKSG